MRTSQWVAMTQCTTISTSKPNVTLMQNITQALTLLAVASSVLLPTPAVCQNATASRATQGERAPVSRNLVAQANSDDIADTAAEDAGPEGSQVPERAGKKVPAKKKPGFIRRMLEPVTELQGQSIKLQEQIIRLERPIEGLHTPITGLSHHVGSVDGQLVGVQKNLTGVRNDLGSVKEELRGVRNDISSLRTQIKSVQTPIASLNEPLTKLYQPIASLESPLIQLQKELSEFKTEVKNLKANMGLLQKPIEDINQPISQLENPIQDLAKPLTTLKAEVVDLKSDLNELADAVTTMTRFVLAASVCVVALIFILIASSVLTMISKFRQRKAFESQTQLNNFDRTTITQRNSRELDREFLKK